jgi:hypothetical protein
MCWRQHPSGDPRSARQFLDHRPTFKVARLLRRDPQSSRMYHALTLELTCGHLVGVVNYLARKPNPTRARCYLCCACAECCSYFGAEWRAQKVLNESFYE